MKREQIRTRITKAIGALERGNTVAALAMLRTIEEAMEPPRPAAPSPTPVAVDADQLATLQAAYGRALAGTITRAEVAEVVGRFQRLPVAQVVALARAFGCGWLPARSSRAAALRAVADRITGPLEARERATF